MKHPLSFGLEASEFRRHSHTGSGCAAILGHVHSIITELSGDVAYDLSSDLQKAHPVSSMMMTFYIQIEFQRTISPLLIDLM